MTSLPLYLSLFFTLFLHSLLVRVQSSSSSSSDDDCITPRGICIERDTGDSAGDETDDSCFYTLSELSNIPLNSVFFRSFPLMNRLYGNHDDLYETAIQFRQTALAVIKRYNTLAAFEETALDFFARDDITTQRRRCQPSDSASDDEVSLFEYHRSVSHIYTSYYIYVFDKPTRLSEYSAFMESWGLNTTLCDDFPESCQNGATDTPWGLAYTLAMEIESLKSRDGWNELGDYDNREYNLIPFRDFRPAGRKYTPVNDPWSLTVLDRWQPLLESDEYGFLFYQEHSVPHIGYTGLSHHFSNDELCDAVDELISEPNYDYMEEILLTFDRMAELTEKQKVEIEFFDAKDNILPFIAQLFLPRGIGTDSFEWLIANTITLQTFYEAGLRAWKAKVDYDKVRPTSIVHEIFEDELITSYAGTTASGETLGTQTFYGRDWEPYIRTMPHAEYPSGSSCVCEAWAEAMRELFGTDNITEITGQGVSATISAFSSENEPLSTPSTDITLEYYSFSEIADRCSQTRLEGGMHFTASVPAGADLCRDVGTRVTQSIVSLASGQKPVFSLDFDTAMYEERVDCYPSSNDDDSTDEPTEEPTQPPVFNF